MSAGNWPGQGRVCQYAAPPPSLRPGAPALDAGHGVSGLVGKGESHLFPARPLVRFGVEWLSKEFGS